MNRLPHQSKKNLSNKFEYIWQRLEKAGEVYLSTPEGKDFYTQSGITIRGKHEGEKVITIFRDGTEFARIYPCCWGFTTNCNQTHIGGYSDALDDWLKGQSVAINIKQNLHNSPTDTVDIFDIDVIKSKIKAFDAELRSSNLIDYIIQKIEGSSPMYFDLDSSLYQIEQIPNKPGIYVIYFKPKSENMKVDWIQGFQDDWVNHNVNGFQHSPAIIQKRLKNKIPSDDWVPLYLGKSEKIGKRILDHIKLEANKKTFALKLIARKHKMQKYDFCIKYVSFDYFQGVQIPLRIWEEELRHRFEPVTGRQ